MALARISERDILAFGSDPGVSLLPRAGGALGGAGDEADRSGVPDEVGHLADEEEDLFPEGARHVTQRGARSRLGLAQARGSVAPAHLQGEVCRHRVFLAHAQLVVGARRSPLGLDLVHDARELETTLASL